ncbi:MAG: hypothetical protein HQ596_04150 [Candidatus Saganbacteria bacterium]|nr:hypothetical protein [Candidatus Saganbacteria bacterium]
MLSKIGKGILVVILCAAVLVGAYLGSRRYFVELQDRTIELCVDLNDLKTIAAYEKRPLGPVLDEVRKRGIISVGIFEETLPDANALGELHYTKGSGILRSPQTIPAFTQLKSKGLIKPERTYIYIPSDDIRKRVYNQLKLTLGKNNINFIGREIMEVDEAEENLRGLGIGMSEAQTEYIFSKGFSLIPRLWNDPSYHLGNISPKISTFKNYDLIIFDGEEILGYPQNINTVADALKKNKIKYGHIEIIKQYGDSSLRKLSERNMIRVHSVSADELKKITKPNAIKRFVRAARERKVRLFYLRPFLPPQVDAYPVAYNLDYFGKVKNSLQEAGFVMGRAEQITPLTLAPWQILLLGLGVLIGALFLLNYFVKLPIPVMYLLLLVGAGGIYFGVGAGYALLLQKALALLCAITFPALAVISSLSLKRKNGLVLWDSILIIVNIVAEAMIGVFLLVGLLADYRFMLGVETFSGVKLALLLPIMIVALYFMLNLGSGSLKNRIRVFLDTKVSLAAVLFGLFALGALAVFIARSGNFVLPVPAIEKYFRNFLETVFFIRPRTKEFLIGYPFLFLAALSVLRDKRKWLWVLAAIGTIAPISIINSFSHIHTPIMISMIRTVNGLVLGVIIGSIVVLIFDRFISK